LRSQGCEFLRVKVTVIRGGGIRLKTNIHLCLGIRKSMIILQEKYAKTLA
jgi:hypothetical protein